MTLRCPPPPPQWDVFERKDGSAYLAKGDPKRGNYHAFDVGCDFAMAVWIAIAMRMLDEKEAGR